MKKRKNFFFSSSSSLHFHWTLALMHAPKQSCREKEFNIILNFATFKENLLTCRVRYHLDDEHPGLEHPQHFKGDVTQQDHPGRPATERHTQMPCHRFDMDFQREILKRTTKRKRGGNGWEEKRSATDSIRFTAAAAPITTNDLREGSTPSTL